MRRRASQVATAILLSLASAGCGDEPLQNTTACYARPEGVDTCLPPEDVDRSELFVSGWCDSEVESLEGPGEARIAGQANVPSCCYPARARDTQPNCIVGRPYMQGDGLGLASIEGAACASAFAAAWLEAARGEHASIGAFARLTFDLMALGAPLSLLGEVQRAAADEVAHAERCLQIAEALGAPASTLGAFPFTEPVTPRADPVAVAVDCVREGCLGETVGAWLAERAVHDAPQGAVRDALAEITADETRHAALSWRIVAWLIQRDGELVREAVRAALQEPLALGCPAHLWRRAPDDQTMEAWLGEVHAELLEPASRLLLAA